MGPLARAVRLRPRRAPSRSRPSAGGRRGGSAWALWLALSACGPGAPPRGPAPTPDDDAALASATTTSGPEQCGNATDDNQNGLFDEGCGLSLGVVQFLASWDTAKADVDLRVVDPNGELIEVGRVARSGLTKDRDCPGRGNECQGRNLENVYLTEGAPVKGDYRLQLRLESLGGEASPVRVRVGARLGAVSRSFEVVLEAPEAEREIRFRL